MIIANGAALLGKISWDLFTFGAEAESVEKEAFNLAYHLKQSYGEVMRWPSRLRRANWKRVLDQYDFEDEQIKSKTGK